MVSGNPKLSIGKAGSFKIRKLHSMSAVVMKIERLGPGDVLQMQAQVEFQMWHPPLPESEWAELNVMPGATTKHIDPSLRVEDFWVICDHLGWQHFSIYHTLVRKLTSDLQQRCQQGSDNHSKGWNPWNMLDEPQETTITLAHHQGL